MKTLHSAAAELTEPLCINVKLPDKDTCTIWYCLLAFGAITSFFLRQFASVPILHSIWATVPTFLIAGYFGMRGMDRAIEDSIRRANTPIQVSVVTGLGELRQFPERWEIALEPKHCLSGCHETTFTIDASNDGPTNRQLELARHFTRKYAEIEPHIRDKLRDFFAEIGATEEYNTVDFDNMSVHIVSPEDETDVEIWYETIDEHSDMGYAVCLSDWKVREVYGGD